MAGRKIRVAALLVSFSMLCAGCGNASTARVQTFTNPIAANANDPWVVFHEGWYYYCYSGQGGVCVAKMENFFDIGTAQAVCVWRPEAGKPYSQELWAPELHFLDGRWYIYVAADDGNNDNHRMYVLAGGEDPLQPFSLKGKLAAETDRWAIDGTVLQLNEKRYFIWSGWDGDTNIAQHLFIAEMDTPWSLRGERVKISSPTYDWEKVGTPYVNEGPAVLQRDGRTYLAYSASGSWTDDYCIAFLELTGEDPMQPESWRKLMLPAMRKSETVFGPGHCSFTVSPDGTQDWMLYHANLESGTGWAGRRGWAVPVRWSADGRPQLGEPAEPGSVWQVG